MGKRKGNLGGRLLDIVDVLRSRSQQRAATTKLLPLQPVSGPAAPPRQPPTPTTRQFPTLGTRKKALLGVRRNKSRRPPPPPPSPPPARLTQSPVRFPLCLRLVLLSPRPFLGLAPSNSRATRPESSCWRPHGGPRVGVRTKRALHTGGLMGPAAGARRSGAMIRAAAVAVVALALALPLAAALRPLRERVVTVGTAGSAASWGDEHAFFKRDENDMSPYSWNITGTYKGTWSFAGASNGSSRFLEFVKPKGDSVLELLSTPTKISGVHYVQGSITFHDVIDNAHDHAVAQIRLEGVYIWPFRQLRMVANSCLYFLVAQMVSHFKKRITFCLIHTIW
ncbi:hypothetical protein PR202_gb20890 [Eleusine coracana subsp. coracana]|uniref:Uncharacterized protein n=1 Tax=Eleusine coracana subsp. coracana TaxID=191504 RepID=A0AAV5F9R0_ELECO|nr:hypothetical protein PR202_gb20890 [Eleusine coracana subsp. coracana]